MTSPALLLAGLEWHKATLEYLHMNSINSRRSWAADEDERFHGDDDSVESDYDPTNEEQAAAHRERQNLACIQIKEEYIQPLDLHGFTALHTVSVHATDLLGAMNKSNASDYIPLSTVLPPTLRHLNLRYSNYFSDWDPQLDFVYREDVGDQYNDFVPWEVEHWIPPKSWFEAYYGHLLELLESKTLQLPELVKLELAIQADWPRPGQNIVEMAEAQGVVLTVVDLEDECPSVS
jgi:hypothetical protein